MTNLNRKTPDYREGSTIQYRPFGGGQTRTVTVGERLENVKNGEPGFGGTDTDGEGVWGYDDQITRVITY
jgi:hypothetical protein